MTSNGILIVEDEAIVARDLRSRLIRLGYGVCGTTGRGDEAVRLAGDLGPTLVLMDICLQGPMDGVAAAEAIRTRFDLPVVYVTAHADEATLHRARVTEPYGYILKPFEERELRTAIEIARYKHETERRLRQNERRYAATLASIGDGVLVTDAAGLVTYANPAAERATGWPAAEAVGRPAAEVVRLVHEETRAPAPSAIDRVLRTGVPVDRTGGTLLLSRSGTEIPIEAGATPIHDDGDATAGAVLVFHDVTEQRRLEDQLRQSQKMEGIGQLAGGIAHDFNNLLTAILGYADVVIEAAGPDHHWAGFLAEIRRSGQRAAELTRQLLAFSRKQLALPCVIDVNERVADTERMLRRLLGPQIELTTFLDPALGTVKADPGQIEQILINLAVNARDAMPDGGRLSIDTANVTVPPNGPGRPADLEAGEYRQIRVSDTGCGMPPAVLARVFEPFFTTKGIGKGTGLGLSTVYGIVKRCGGHIDIASEVGRGTTLTILLPANVDSVVPAPESSVHRSVPGGKETILFVDDESSIRTLGAHILTESGYTLLEAANGVEALELAAAYADPIHLLITDVLMPRMGGRPLVECLTRDRPGIKVLCITGHSEAGDTPTDELQSQVGYLQKPFTIEELAVAVRRILDY